MKATDLVLGMEYRVQYLGARCKLVHIGKGHGDVHRVKVLFPDTGEDAGKEEKHCSSRHIMESFPDLIARNPKFIDNVKAQRLKAEEEQEQQRLQQEFVSSVKAVCSETEMLLNALGFEAVLVQGIPYKGDDLFYIRINNPTENQGLLRRLVAEKWGQIPQERQDDLPVTPTEYLTEQVKTPEDQ